MDGVVHGIFTAILFGELVLGNFGNGFIALVNCTDWVKRRKISSADKILTALAISRMSTLWSAVILVLVTLYPNVVKSVEMIQIMGVFWRVSAHLSIWLATCLGMFYFLKIANFSNLSFLYLRWRIKKVILGTFLVSLVSLFLNIVLVDTRIGVLNDVYKVNMSCRPNLITCAVFPKHFLLSYIVSYSMPFLVSLTTFLLLIFSLWKHRTKVQQNHKGSEDVSTTAHVKAMQTVIAFLILYTVFFLSLLVQVLKTDFVGKLLFGLVTQAAEMAFPSGHSFVLILGNSKLRQTFILMVKWLRCRYRDVESTGPQSI